MKSTNPFVLHLKRHKLFLEQVSNTFLMSDLFPTLIDFYSFATKDTLKRTHVVIDLEPSCQLNV